MSNNTPKEFPPKEYFKSTGNKIYDILKENIDRLEREELEYAVWGAGGSWFRTKAAIEEYTGETSKEKYLVDNNTLISDGVHTLTPDQFKEHMDEIDTIFLCVFVADLVREQLLTMGFKGNIITMLCQSDFGEEFIERELENYDKYKWLYEKVTDDKSKMTIINWLLAAGSGDLSLYEEVNGSSHYRVLEKDILHTSDNEHYIDVGAFDGDTIKLLLETTNGKYDSILAIEADPVSYQGLLKTTAGMRDTICINAACGKEDGKIHFAGHSESGGIVDEGGVVVPMLALDGILEAQGATFIKLSANGYEHNILQGAREIIKKNKPKLSYYCFGTQKWEIPELLSELVPEYKFYVRHYGMGYHALAGYAICE